VNSGQIASGGHDGTIRLWNVDHGQLIKTLEPHTDWIEALYFNQDGQTLLSSDSGRNLRLWNVSNGNLIGTFKLDTERVIFSATFGPNGHVLASAAGDETVQLWDTRIGEGVILAFSPDGHILASGGTDGIVRLWGVPGL
jgi:WD40 repeat protein